MKTPSHLILIAFSFLLVCSFLFGQEKEKRIFLIEDIEKKQWCSYSSEDAWKKEVQDIASMNVGTLLYMQEDISEIYITRQAESGDWVVYDHYFLDTKKQIARLSRTINILPGDRINSQSFEFVDGKARRKETIEKRLSTGEVLVHPDSIWLPDLPVFTKLKEFPFAALLDNAGVKTSAHVCAGTGTTKN